MKKTKIIFFGTPDFAVKSLKVINDNFDVLCVVTSPDKKSGRGLKINESEVKRFSSNNNIPVKQPENLTNDDFLDEISSLGAELFIVVAFKKLPKEVFSIPALGTINLHASLLPDYRGAAPINWVLINNEKVTGVTTFFINERIDHGDIILKEKITINDEDDFESLYNKLSIIGSKVLLRTIIIVASGKAKIQKQDESKGLNLAPKLNARNTRINWNDNIDKILGMVRGLSPSPGSWTTLKNGDKEKILRPVSELVSLGFEIYATDGTAEFFNKNSWLPLLSMPPFSKVKITSAFCIVLNLCAIIIVVLSFINSSSAN